MAIRLILRKTTKVVVGNLKPSAVATLFHNEHEYCRRLCSSPSSNSKKPEKMFHHANKLLYSITAQGVYDVLHDLEEKGIGTKKHYLRAIERLGQIGQVKEAIKIPSLMQETGRYHHSSINAACMTALIVCREKKRIDLAEKLLTTMEKTGGSMTPDKFHYREVILCCTKADTVMVMEILDRMNASECEPDIHCYHAALSKMSRGSHINLCLTLLNSMRTVPGCSPDLYAFNLVLASLAAGGDGFSKIARQLLLRTMPAVGVIPNEYSYSLAMNAAIKEGGWEAALELYAYYCDQEKEPTVKEDGDGSPPPIPFRIFKSVLLACAKGGEPQIALEIINYINKHECNFSSTQEYNDALACYNMAISACSNGGEVASALSIYEYVDDHEVLKPDAFTCSAAIYACSTIGDWETAVALLFAAENIHGITPNTVMYTTVMGAYSVVGKWQEAEKILELMLKLVDERSGDEMVAVYPNDLTFEALFRAGGSAQTTYPVKKWFKRWKMLHGRKPGEPEPLREVSTFRSALVACVKGRDYKTGLDILKDYRQMHGWSKEDDDSLVHLKAPYKVSIPRAQKYGIFPPDMSPHDKWFSECDAIIMSTLCYSSLDMANQVITELGYHRTYQPHHLVTTYINNRFNRSWEDVVREGILKFRYFD